MATRCLADFFDGAGIFARGTGRRGIEMNHPLQHHDGLPPRRPPVAKGLRFRSFGLGFLFVAVSLSFRFWDNHAGAVARIIMVLLLLIIFFIVMACSAFGRPSYWQNHALSFALGILAGFPVSLVVSGIADQIIHPVPAVRLPSTTNSGGTQSILGGK